jgi:pimeloyl-ACP methyl ester carboxylesterase
MHIPGAVASLLPLCLVAVEAVMLPAPAGPYNVGFTQHIFNHTTPNDPTPGGGTFYLASIYYPTRSDPSPNTSVPYFDPTSAVIWGEVFNILPADLLSLESALQWRAPLLCEKEDVEKVEAWPTLVFGPGGGMNAGYFTSLLSDLASQGYTVIALDHPGEAPYLALLDGEPGVVGWDINMPYSDELILDIYEFRRGDLLAVLAEDGFPALVEALGAYFNTEAYAAFGHSTGGAAATGAMGRTGKIVAGLNIDGGFYGDSVNASMHGRPYFMTMNPNHFALDADTWPAFATRYYNESLTAPGWLDWTTVQGSAHLAFSDIALWVELLPTIPNTTAQVDLGNVTASRMDALLKTYVSGFWEFVRGGEYNATLLDGPVEEWPEVVFNAKVRSDGPQEY